jgi:hypothetical protein
MLGQALSFPRHGDDWVKTVAIGGGLLVLSVLVLPAILLQGYLVRVVRAGANGDRGPPAFDDWGSLFVDGLKLIVVSVGYYLPATLVVVVATVVVGSGALVGGEAGAGIGILGGVGLLVGVLLVLVATYLLPAAVANMAVRDSLGAAFDLGTVAGAALTTDYAVAVLLALVAGFLFNLVGSPLLIVLVGAGVLFYGQVVVYYLFGRGFAAGRGPAGYDTTPAL